MTKTIRTDVTLERAKELSECTKDNLLMEGYAIIEHKKSHIFYAIDIDRPILHKWLLASHTTKEINLKKNIYIFGKQFRVFKKHENTYEKIIDWFEKRIKLGDEYVVRTW